MEKLENLFDKIENTSKYPVFSATGISEYINKINYQTDVLFFAFAIIVCAAAGYSVYNYFKYLKRRY